MKYKPSRGSGDLGKLLKSPSMKRVVTSAAEAGADAARRVVPRDSGTLAESIHTEDAGNSGGPHGDRVEIRIVSDAPHTLAVQFGSKNQSAQPFLEAAIDEIEGNR